MIAPALLLLGGYLLGSLQAGLLVGRVYRGVDVREYGSGKTGFTNALRTLGLRAAAIVLAIDVAKGALPVLIGRWLLDDPWAASLGGTGAVIGHTWPLFAAFRGGRGVATSFGGFVAMAPLVALAVLAASASVLAATRYVSVMSISGMLAGLAALIALVASGRLDPAYLLYGIVVTLSVEVNHRSNLRRLLAGTEPKLGQGGARRSPRGT
ncbi:MAG: glycerol-3-phosphate 1-O-acyltransferase PlsY [Chloroflexi bacterium]|nr:glycerol-3-phosphate 1-O-acyltransferase PlsY [Chloroflexota bacterium]